VTNTEQTVKKVPKMKTDLKNDRRTQRTKKSLATALTELIMEKGYEAISVQDIIDRANVGRSTFHSHYENKEQLLLGNINFQQALVHAPDKDPEHYPWGVNLSYLFHHTKEHLPLAKALARTNSIQLLSNYFAEMCAVQICEQLKKRLPQRASRAEVQMARYQAEAAAGAIIRMLFKWLADGATTPTEKMIGYATQILNACCEGKPED
jgi:AcrR family transcriptional regulator